jgi:membrane-bound metal-dependent hydrolase YbcI (DUF457 family)
MSLTLIILALFGIQWSLHWTILVAATLGAVIPDIDHPRSLIGRLFFFVSKPINDRVGHRGFTHSLLGWLAATFLFATFVFVARWIANETIHTTFMDTTLTELTNRWIGAFSIGYFSHLFLDMFNPRGVQLFWPDKNRDVILKNIQRPESGAKIELVIFGFLLIILILSLPLSKYGMKSSLRWLLATPAAAIEEFKDQKTKSMLIFSGVFRTSKQPVSGRAEIIDVENQRLVIRFNESLYMLSDKLASDILANQVRVERTTIPIRVEHKTFQNETREALLAQVPTGSLVSGIVILPSGLTIAPEGASANVVLPSGLLPPSIHQKGNTLILKYATKAELTHLTADPLFQFEQKRTQSTLKKYQTQTKLIQTQLRQLQKPAAGLTPLGESLFGDKDAKAKRQQQSAELKLQLDQLQLQIEQLQRQLATRKLIYSGDVTVRE